ncbi:MAG: hypothetical protein OEY95_05685 [Candidatus Bathyarchaeota archaeon]|nr:hypothetical protein [Candidatus Bathyarchaeota archaeon]
MSRVARILRTVLVFLVFFAFSTLALTGVCLAVSESEAESKIGEAEMAVSSAYVAVLEVEKSGGNVSGLLIKLDSGAEFLAEAQMCFRNEDFGNAVYYADLSVQSVEGLVEEAEQLKALAIAESEERCFLTVATSGVAVAVIVFGSVVGWRLFRGRYFGKVLKMKPEVVEG